MRLRDLKGIGDKRWESLKKAGIGDLQALIATLPVSYRDTTQSVPLDSLREDATCCVTGTLRSAASLTRSGTLSIVRCVLEDASGILRLVWFNQPWRVGLLRAGTEYAFFGRVERYAGALSMVNPSLVQERAILPVYRALPGLPSGTLLSLIRQALAVSDIRETLPASLRDRYRLCGRSTALQQVHCPTDTASLQEARRRIAFENLLLYHMATLLLHREGRCGILIQESVSDYLRQLPFKPTEAQRRAIRDIEADFCSGRPMRRLLQGDVGSGKTAVVFAAAFLAARAGYQTALMAPTEILARQHLRSAERLLGPLGVKSGLLLGSMPETHRRDALQRIREGDWQLVIGTQALIGRGLHFSRLALAVVDEQHRFGVRQRRTLGEKVSKDLTSHVLALSATPIPRTLALVLYGDLDVSALDELPPGRKQVRTHLVPEHKRSALYAFIRDRVEAGEQAYIVCPRILDQAEDDARGVIGMYRQLAKGPLSGLKLGLAHGGQPSREMEAALLGFTRKETDVLIATSVIEVGIDVPSASVMVIEGANAFGLSQLHQLRGRVGRGDRESWCFLMAGESERLAALCQSTDGFELSRKDLELRGPGEFLGARQHGKSFPSGFGVEDIALLEETLSCAKEMFRETAQADELAVIQRLAESRYAEMMENTALN